jgi:hypothetical protein
MKKTVRKLSDVEIASLKRVVSKDALYLFMESRMLLDTSLFRELLFCEYILLSRKAEKLNNQERVHECLVAWDKAEKVYKKYEALEEM